MSNKKSPTVTPNLVEPLVRCFLRLYSALRTMSIRLTTAKTKISKPFERERISFFHERPGFVLMPNKDLQVFVLSSFLNFPSMHPGAFVLFQNEPISPILLKELKGSGSFVIKISPEDAKEYNSFETIPTGKACHMKDKLCSHRIYCIHRNKPSENE